MRPRITTPENTLMPTRMAMPTAIKAGATTRIAVMTTRMAPSPAGTRTADITPRKARTTAVPVTVVAAIVAQTTSASV